MGHDKKGNVNVEMLLFLLPWYLKIHPLQKIHYCPCKAPDESNRTVLRTKNAGLHPSARMHAVCSHSILITAKRLFPSYKATTRAANPKTKPVIAFAVPAAPPSLTGALGVALPVVLETVPLLPGRPPEMVPLDAAPAAVVCAMSVLLSVAATDGDSVISAADEDTSLSAGVEEAGIGPVTEAKVVYKSQVDSAVSVSRALQSMLLVLEASSSELDSLDSASVEAAAVVEGAEVAEAWYPAR